MKYVISYDVGTTGLKTCIFRLDDKITSLAGSSCGYPLYTLENGGSEQDPNDWWKAMIETTKKIFERCDIKPEQVEAVSFCSQMQAVILVDKDGIPVRRSMGYMDQRATEEVKKGIGYGLQIAGANIFKLIPSLAITGAVSTTPKDPVWKYKWIEAHEPENFARAYKWLDVKDYLIMRLTGEFTMTQDSAFATLIYDNRPKKGGKWSKKMCKMFGVNMDHLPRIIKSTDVAGTVTKKAAEELGLAVGTKVFGGGGDSSLIGIGSGCTKVGDTHIYCGTSGWVNTIVAKRTVDTTNMIAAITGAQDGKYNYFAEMETAGKCFEWVKDHLALDEINIYVEKKHIAEVSYERGRKTLFEHLNNVISTVPAGSNGVIFTPWIHGNRCPFDDPKSMGMFFGIKIDTGKTELVRSVLEGIYYHLRWMLECQDNKIKTSDTIRFVGGGAISPIGCQILADIINRPVETVDNPQNVGSVGAAAVMGVGLGVINSFDDVKDFIPSNHTYLPNKEQHEIYEPYYQVFKNLYKSNKKNFTELKDKSAKDKTKQRAELLKALKFFLFSCSAGIIQLLITTLLGLAPIPTSVCYLVGLVASVIWNFTLNRKFTFKSANNVPIAMLLAFTFYVFFAPASTVLSAYLTNGDVLQLFTLPSHLGILGSNVPSSDIPIGATLVTTFICMVPNLILEFLWQKFVVFRKPKAKKNSVEDALSNEAKEEIKEEGKDKLK